MEIRKGSLTAEWEDFQPAAELENKTVTLFFSEAIEITKPECVKKSFINIKYNDISVDVTGIDIDEGKLIIQLAEYIQPSQGKVILSYKKQDDSLLLKKGTKLYIPSFENLLVNNKNEDLPPFKNQLGFTLENVNSLHESAGTVLATDFPAWGGHQSRLVRTNKGVFFVLLVKGPPGIHKFAVYNIDRPIPELVGEEYITGVSVDLVSDRSDNLYVLCLDTVEGDIMYGRPTAFKYENGQGKAIKIQYQGNEFTKDGGYNYEGVCVDYSGKIIMTIASVNNNKQYASKLKWLVLDTANDSWGEVYSYPVKWSELYIYVLPKQDGTIGLVTNAAAGFSQLGYKTPPGCTYSWFSLTLWDIPNLSSNVINKVWKFDLPFTENLPEPRVGNNYDGDAYVDSLGYTHILLSAEHVLGVNGYPRQTRYVIFDRNNRKILDRKLFDGINSCRFVEISNGNLYILKMAYRTSKLEVYKVKDDHKDIDSEVPVFIKNIVNLNGDSYNLVYSGISLTSVRGGNNREDFADIVFPVDETGNGIATDWIFFRLTFAGLS